MRRLFGLGLAAGLPTGFFLATALSDGSGWAPFALAVVFCGLALLALVCLTCPEKPVPGSRTRERDGRR